MSGTRELLHAMVALRLPYFELGDTGRDVLQRFLSIDVSNSALARIIARNQYYKDSLEQYVTAQLGGRSLSDMAQDEESVKKLAEDADGADPEDEELNKKEASLSYAILLVGMLGTRDFILAWRMRRGLGLEPPNLHEEDAQKRYKPKNDLTLAIKTQEFCREKNISYPESAGYAAGLVFDWLSLYTSSWKEKNKALETFILDSWKRSVKRGYLVSILASKVPNFAYAKFAFASGMLIDVGKILLALHYRKNPSGSEWIDFEKELENHSLKYKLPIDRLQEEQGNPLTHEEINELFIDYFPIFSPIKRAIRHYREPYLLQTYNKDLYQLASVLAAATWVNSVRKIPDPKSKDWEILLKKRWYKDLNISDDLFAECAKQAFEASVS